MGVCPGGGGLSKEFFKLLSFLSRMHNKIMVKNAISTTKTLRYRTRFSLVSLA